MKKLFILITMLTVSVFSEAQNQKYISSMEKNLAVLDTTRDVKILQDLANKFERIASAEKAEWLPNYYVAYCYVNMTYSVKGNTIDTYCDKAEAFINKADSLLPNNSEIYTLKSQIASARISVNPMTRGQKYGTLSAEIREKAKALDPTNPRPYYLEGTGFFYTPPMFGGSKEKAKASFEKALSLFETFKSSSSISPRWGKESTIYFIQQCEEKK